MVENKPVVERTVVERTVVETTSAVVETTSAVVESIHPIRISCKCIQQFTRLCQPYPPVPCPGTFTVVHAITKKVPAKLHECKLFPTFVDFHSYTWIYGPCTRFSSFSTICSFGFNCS